MKTQSESFRAFFQCWHHFIHHPASVVATETHNILQYNLSSTIKRHVFSQICTDRTSRALSHTPVLVVLRRMQCYEIESFTRSDLLLIEILYGWNRSRYWHFCRIGQRVKDSI